MDSSAPRDRISNLPETILVLINSFLPFKQRVRTSGVSRVWRHLYRETKHVAFRQSDFVSPDVYHQPKLYGKAMVAFADFMCRWVRTNGHYPIDSLELCIHDTDVISDVIIQEMIAFAVQKEVKKLVLDFSNPDWEYYGDVDPLDLVVEVPESVYKLTTLQVLRVWACKNFEPSRFSNPGNFKILSFGWMSLKNLQPLLSKCSRLDTLTIDGCCNVEFNELSGNMREFGVENSDLSFTCSFNLPNLEIFRFIGFIVSLKFKRMNRVMEDVYLDFCAEVNEDDEEQDPTDLDVRTLCDNLNHLPSSTRLTILPYALEVIQKAEHPHLLHQVKTQHLMLQTELQPKEFCGIWLFLNSCTHLETLTFDMLPPNSIVTASPTPWMKGIAYNYLRKTIKAVAIRDFAGVPNELNLVKYLIQSRCKHDLLERVELYVADELGNSQKEFAYAEAKMLQRSSKRVQVLVK